jgi:hypothetical protein
MHGSQTALRIVPLSDLCAARPTIWGALTSLPRVENATSRYEGSNRYYRGRVLAALREAPEEGVPLRQLGTILREDFGDEDLSQLSCILETLEKDGLVKVSSTEDWPRAIAEERAAYWTERPEDPTYATTHVGLP